METRTMMRANQMSETVKARYRAMEVWRPLSLGIGSSLSISKRARNEQTMDSLKPVTRSTTSQSTKSATTPRQRTAVKENIRSKSVMAKRLKLPAYSPATQLSRSEDAALPTDSTSAVPSLPPAILSKTTPTMDCIAALRVLPVKKDISPYLQMHAAQVNKQIKHFIEQLTGCSINEKHNSFTPSALKRVNQQGMPVPDNKYLAYVENLMRKRYYKIIQEHFADAAADEDSDSSEDSKEDSPEQLLPKLVTLNLHSRSTASSSTAPNAVYPGAELLNCGGDNRKSSSETRTSSSPDDANVNNLSNRIRRRDNRPSSRGKHRLSQPNGLIPIDKSGDCELPSVLDENITGTRLNPLTQQGKVGRTTGRPAVLKPLNSSEQLTATTSIQHSQPSHKNTNPLSISGLAKPETGIEEANEAGWTQTQNCKVLTVTRPPAITSQHSNHNNSNSAASTSSHSTGAFKSETNGPLASLTVTATSSLAYNSSPKRTLRHPTYSQSNSGNSTKQPQRKTTSSSESDAKYADPIAGASPSFQTRLSELASLEAETVRYERLRKLKKKSKERDD